MSCFDVDCFVDYDDYKKTIYHHGVNFEVRQRTAESNLNIAKGLLDKALSSAYEKKYDYAWYYFVRCVHVIEEAKLRDANPEAKKLLRRCIDGMEGVVNDGLYKHYTEMIARVQEKEVERKRIVELQMQTDPEEKEVVQTQTHERRKEDLLNREPSQLELLRRALHEAGPSAVVASPAATVPLTGGKPTPLYRPQSSTVPQPTLTHPAPSQPTANGQQNHYDVHVKDKLTFAPNTSGPRTRFQLWQFNKNSPSSLQVLQHRGMVNLGNTCYLNSVFQVLTATPISQYFIGSEYTNDIVDGARGNGQVVQTFTYVLMELNRTNCKTPVSPSPFKRAFGQAFSAFNNSSQQDANEFLRTLLDGIHSSINVNGNVKQAFKEIDTKKGTDVDVALRYWAQYITCNRSVIVDLCSFQERSTLRCPRCQNSSRTFSVLNGVDVPIPVKSSETSIEDCLQLYCAEEMLEATSLYTCTFCSQKVRAIKQLSFFNAPKVLFITLKRFRSYGDFSNKVTTDVAFQPILDLSPYICVPQQGGAKYRLTGVVNHQGNIHGGHYTADCLGKDNTWYSCSDERVTLGTAPNYKLAYILCYVRM